MRSAAIRGLVVRTELSRQSAHALLAMARSVKENRFQPGVVFLGIKDGVVDFVINDSLAARVPAALRARIGAARDSIIAGTLRVPSVEFVHDSVPLARPQ